MRCLSVICEPLPRSPGAALRLPELRFDAWWTGHVARVLHANGLAVNRTNVINQLDATIAQRYSAASVERLRSGEWAGGATRRHAGLVVPAWAVRGPTSAIQLCQRCLVAAPYLRLAWQLRSTTHCLEHAIELTGQCPRCERPWSVRQVVTETCACGYRIRQSDAGIASSDSRLRFAQWLESVSGDLATRLLLSRLVPSLLSPHSATTTELERFCTDVLSGLGQGSAAVSDLWQRLPTVLQITRALRVIRWIEAGERANPSILCELPLERWATELVDLGAGSHLSPTGAYKLTKGPRRYFVLGDAAAMAGMTGARVRGLVEHGLVRPAKVFGDGQPRVLLAADQIGLLQTFQFAEYGGSTDLILGLKGSSLRTLRRSGLAPLTPDAYQRRWMDSQALRSILGDLEAKAKPLPRDAKWLVRLDSRQIWQSRYESVLGAVILKLRQGDLPVFAGEEGKGFARLFVDHHTVLTLDRLCRLRPATKDDSAQAGLFASTLGEPVAHLPQASPMRYWKPLQMRRSFPERREQLDLFS